MRKWALGTEKGQFMSHVSILHLCGHFMFVGHFNISLCPFCVSLWSFFHQISHIWSYYGLFFLVFPTILYHLIEFCELHKKYFHFMQSLWPRGPLNSGAWAVIKSCIKHSWVVAKSTNVNSCDLFIKHSSTCQLLYSCSWFIGKMIYVFSLNCSSIHNV